MRSVAWRARGGDAPAEPGFRILLYHRVSDDRDELAELDRHGFTATVFVATGVTDGRVPLSWHARDSLLDFRAKLGGGFDRPSRARVVWRRARPAD